MSTDPLPTFSSHSTPANPQFIANFAPKTSDSSYQSLLKSPQPGPSTWQSSNNPTPQKAQKKKLRTSEENEITDATAARFVSRLAEDHAAALNPDVDSPFIDTVDIVKRLLPYHIYLNPKEDLKPLIFDRKGKSRADQLRKENEETKFALSCFKRRRNLEKRFRIARIKTGQTPFKEAAVVLDQVVLETERSELAKLNSELRAARAELERLERAKRAASSTPRHSYYPSAVPTSVPTAPTAYYRAYPYAYAQAYGTALATPPSISTFAITPTAAAAAPVSTSHSAQAPVHGSSAPTTSTLVPAAIPAPTAASPSVGSAIPVQLPLSSLPALHQLGIIPAVASAPATGQPAPAAILRGSAGNMLNLEINVSQLQPAQMSGLALILNSLMSRTNSPSVAQVSATPLSSAATTSASTTSNITANGDSG